MQAPAGKARCPAKAASQFKGKVHVTVEMAGAVAQTKFK